MNSTPYYDVMTGNRAIAYAVKLSRVKVIPIYPITPQTSISEYLAEFVANGELDAEYVHAEGEHSAMAIAIGASISGNRVFTSTSSQGLAYMHECVAQAAGFRAPIVMAVANRRVGSIWSLGADYTDVMPETNLGWIIYFVESNQEALDTLIQLYRIAEDDRVLLPAMLNIDGFYLSFSCERVCVPEQRDVDSFLPEYRPKFAVNPLVSKAYPNVFPPPPEGLTAYSRMYEEVFEEARKVIYEVEEKFYDVFGRRYGGPVECYSLEGAEYALITVGSMSTAAKRAVDKLRMEGVKAGLLRIRVYRPFPHREVRELLEHVKGLGVVDRSVNHGTGRGPIFCDTRATLYGAGEKKVYNFITGLGGEDVSIKDFINMFKILIERDEGGEVYYIEHPTPKQDRRIPPSEIADGGRRLIFSGGEGCPGCTIPILMRHTLEVLGPNVAFSFPPHCAGISFSCGVLNVPYYIANFAAGAAYATGTFRGYRTKNMADKIVSAVWAGDGGTYDIGFQSLSAAAERGESVLYICYDNEAYMNTGVQRSGATPLGAYTTTTPVGRVWRGKGERRKDMPLIMSMHRIPYIATGAPSHVNDLKSKVGKAKDVVLKKKGLAYLHFIQPCPTGWFFDASKSIEVSRLAVLTGVWPLFEIEDGRLKITYKPSKLKPVKEYLSMQGRYRHLTEKEVDAIQEDVIGYWNMLRELEKFDKLPWYF